MAQCGLGSRRACDRIIAERRVSIDGDLVENPGVQVESVQNVQVDGKPVALQRFVYLMLNKPKDVLCTNEDTHGRKTYLDLVPDLSERVFPVGRLDRDSEGLLLITNDGDLANRLIHPRYEVEKVYEVQTAHPLSEEDLAQLCRGVFSEGDHLSAVKITPLDSVEGYEFRLREGKNRQIRRMVEKVGNDVTRLKRVAFGPLTVAGLQRGTCRVLQSDEIALLKQLTE